MYFLVNNGITAVFKLGSDIMSYILVEFLLFQKTICQIQTGGNNEDDQCGDNNAQTLVERFVTRVFRSVFQVFDDEESSNPNEETVDAI